jgi:Uma2 family endonuclease
MARIEPTLSYEHLRQTPDDGKRYEILEGELVVTASPNTRHQEIAGNLFGLLRQAQQRGYGRAYTAPIDVVLHETEAAVVPDLVFVAKERLATVKKEAIRGAPDLLVEILSPTTSKRDLGIKLRQYAKHGVSWYWVVNPEAREIRVFARRDGSYEEQGTLRPGAKLSSPLFPGIEIDVADVFA